MKEIGELSRRVKVRSSLWFAKNASGAKTHVSTSIASGFDRAIVAI
jgi:hypothetical protein